MESLHTAAIVLPAISASTGFFRSIHDISLPLSSNLEDSGKKLTQISMMKPYQNGVQSVMATLIKTSFSIVEQYYRINPLTIYSAVSLAGIQSFNKFINEETGKHSKRSK